MGLFREFFLIVAGGFVGSVLGTAFGALVGLLFPDFVAIIWRPEPVGPTAPLGAGMGMVLGLPIGAAAMAAGRLIGAVRWWAGIREAAPPMSTLPPHECPRPLRQAFLDLLTWTLLHIRNEPGDARLSLALADHVHNVPALLAGFRPDLLRYYWEVERPCFLRALEAIGRQAPGQFGEPWGVVEAEYRRLCRPPAA